MDSKDFKQLRNSIKTGRVAGRDTDPLFYNTLAVLPNPDPILRRLGYADNVHDAVMYDAHVMGELRSVRAGLIQFSHRVRPANEGERENKAAELCNEWLKWQPAPNITWPDVWWNMHDAVHRGFRVHELVWGKWDNYLMPMQVLDVPNRRFVFDNDNHLRLRTRSHPTDGEALDDYRYLLTRHMPSSENPYGIALFSSCFWPYTFKHGGWKFFYKFCERFGLPWPVGTYPQGTPEKEQDALADALAEMIEAGYAAIPDGDKVNLLTVNSSGELAQERLIVLANSEMSKALTSQSLISNQQSVGSFAATKTSREREGSVHESNRAIIESTMNVAFELITRINFGDDVPPPRFELFRPGQANKDLVDTYKVAAEISDRVDLEDFHVRTGIKMAAPGAATLQVSAQSSAAVSPSNDASQLDFAKQHDDALDGIIEEAIQQADDAIEKRWLKPVHDMLSDYVRDGKTIDDFIEDLPVLFGKLDDDELLALNEAALKLAWSTGYVDE